MPRHLISTPHHPHLSHARRGLIWAIPLALVIPGLAIGAATAQADPGVTDDCIAQKVTEMIVTPSSPVRVGSTYTVAVRQMTDRTDCLPEGPVTVQFSTTTPQDPTVGAGGQPRFSATSCVLDLTGTCSVTVTSTTPGTFDIHATIADPATGKLTDIGGTGDPTKQSPQAVTWMGPVIDPWTALLQQIQLILNWLFTLLQSILTILPVPLHTV